MIGIDGSPSPSKCFGLFVVSLSRTASNGSSRSGKEDGVRAYVSSAVEREKMKEGAAVGQSQQVSVQDKPATQATQTRFAPATFLHEPGLSRWFYGCSARVSTLGR